VFVSIILVPMQQRDFNRFAQRALAEYAQGMVVAGEWLSAQALTQASEVFRELLPEGRVTAGNHLWRVVSAGRQRGDLWVAERLAGARRIAFILDLYIEPAERRRGYARQTLLAAESKARELGCDEMRLHVFGHNHGARRLYELQGYEVASLTMSKPLLLP
jgi:GNAT superfamily N-acetyltransferase